MTTSLPSKKITIADCPEITQFTGKFVYNFFMPDEKVNEQSKITVDFLKTKQPSDAVNTVYKDPKTLKRFVPRYIKLDWKPVFYLTNINNPPPIQVSIKENLDKIYDETSFTVDDYTNVILQDTTKDQKIGFYIKSFIKNIRKKIPNNKTFESPLDLIKAIRPYLPEQITDKFLTDSVIMEDNGYYFIKSDEQLKLDTKSTLKEISKIKSRVQINNKIVNKYLNSIKQNTTNIFNDEIQSIIDETASIQQRAISNGSSNIFDINEYDIEIQNAVDIRSVDADNFDSYVGVIGYIIRKKDITNPDNIIDYPPIVIENPLAASTIDLNAKYGARYQYTIESVVEVTVQAQDIQNNDVLAITFLLCSQPSSAILVECEEYVPPAPPADFNVAWDYISNCPRISWSFPFEQQRDVKYFQIFKRNSIYEPFQMVKMYDFDDSQVKTQLNETPDPTLIETNLNPKLFFLDKEFTKNSKPQIYTVCCLDAHGYSSNYSTQLEISFDLFKNKINKKTISKSGAPKAYPNLYLQQDLFVDSIQDSAHSKMKVYFNPEYYKVTDENNTDLKLIKTGFGSKYQIQLINVDLQEQQVFEVNLEDLSSTGINKI